jgi:ATPase subunit of ABC transporter with duplicated ATPase domains
MPIIFKLAAICLAILLAFQSLGHAARYGRGNSSMMKKLFQAQAQQSQAQQKAMQEAAARQAAIEQHKREMHAKASKARHEKEEKDRQATLDRLKAKQNSPSTPTRTDSAKSDAPKLDQ